jgi:hypothetical protein
MVYREALVMRIMADGIYPANLPGNAPMVAAYVDGKWPNYRQLEQLFPRAIPMSICVWPESDAQIADCEPDNPRMTPTAVVDWVIRQRHNGNPYPWVYCNELDRAWGWPAVRTAFQARGITEPLYWVANYDRPPGIPPGAIGHQFQGTTAPGYDLSVMAPFIPGVDREPAPVKFTKGNDMCATLFQQVDETGKAITSKRILDTGTTLILCTDPLSGSGAPLVYLGTDDYNVLRDKAVSK